MVRRAKKSSTIESENTSDSSNSNINNNEWNEITPNDVLLGRGGLTNSHCGNKTFRSVVSEYQQEYLHARKKEKKEIATRIVARIHESGGRFLKRTADSGVWSEVTVKKATEKTSQALREGLDVRHRTVRPEKLFHPRDNDESNPRKRARLVEGMVMDSPKFYGSTGGEVPELNQEEEEHEAHLADEYQSHPFPTSYNMIDPYFNFFQNHHHSPHMIEPTTTAGADCKNVEQI
jgi:hypothetical protein